MLDDIHFIVLVLCRTCSLTRELFRFLCNLLLISGTSSATSASSISCCVSSSFFLPVFANGPICATFCQVSNSILRTRWCSNFSCLFFISPKVSQRHRHKIVNGTYSVLMGLDCMFIAGVHGGAITQARDWARRAACANPCSFLRSCLVSSHRMEALQHLIDGICFTSCLLG